MVKVKYNVRKKAPNNNGPLVEHVRKFPSFQLAIHFVRSELKPNESVVGKPVVEGDDE